MKKSTMIIIGIASAVVVLIGTIYLTSSYTLKAHERAQEKAFERDREKVIGKRVPSGRDEMLEKYQAIADEIKAAKEKDKKK